MEQITPEKAQKILSNNGLEVSLEKAKMILDFLNNLANISIAVYLIKDPDR